MDIPRIRSEVLQATLKFALVEAHPTNDGGVFVKAGPQTSVGIAGAPARPDHVRLLHQLPKRGSARVAARPDRLRRACLFGKPA